MLLSKKGYPEEDEMVLCTVTGINPHSVFCTLDEYGGKTGMIHISEIASGRIRNIREHVQEGKKLVCKVLRVNQQKGHIDLSLRRVNDMQRRIKLNEIKQEQLCEKIIDNVARELKVDSKKLYSDISNKLTQKYASLFNAFELVVKGELDLSKELDPKVAKALEEAVKSRIKPPEVAIRGKLKLSSHSSTGVEDIKTALSKAVNSGIKVHYLGAGTYHLEVKAEDYKSAEKILKKGLDETIAYAQKHNIQHEWARSES